MKLSEAAKIVAIALVAYAAIASIRYRLTNPTLTETQLILKSIDALAWR